MNPETDRRASAAQTVWALVLTLLPWPVLALLLTR